LVQRSNLKEKHDSPKNKYDIEIYNVTKRYPLRKKNTEIIALKGINLKIKKGEIFGLLGPNGAGKTTLVSILTTLLQPTQGHALILGQNILKKPWVVKENVGLMFGGEMLYYRLTGFNNLKYYSKIYGVQNYREKIIDLCEKLNLSRWLNQYVATYSKGMKLKLALARVLLIDPKILFLDEPMLGLDPITVKEVITFLLNLKRTIFLTSHQMNVVSKLCDRIAFMKEGEVLKVGTQKEFKELLYEKINFQISLKSKKEEFVKSVKDLNFIADIKFVEDWIRFSINNDRYLPELFGFLKDYSVSSFTQLEPELSDVFIKLNT
jgi:ABC-2 type transport system ATP-binding protein